MAGVGLRGTPDNMLCVAKIGRGLFKDDLPGIRVLESKLQLWYDVLLVLTYQGSLWSSLRLGCLGRRELGQVPRCLGGSRLGILFSSEEINANQAS